MSTDTYADDEDIPTPAPDEYGFTLSGGGMFAGSRYFTISGGTFNNVMKNYYTAPAVPADFRMIPMGDIDLQNELVVNKRRSTIGRRGRNCVRRVYSATIDGRNSNITVAVYQGNGAEGDWKRDTEMYTSVRHPNIIQICGGASYGNIHATLFHGDLVPIKQFIAPHSPIVRVYLYAHYTQEWKQVANYVASVWQKVLDSWECTMWIRTSTGRLSVDLVPPDNGLLLDLYASSVVASLRQAATPSNVTEVIAIESLALKQYHYICSRYLDKYQHDSIPTSATVHIGLVTSWPSGHQYEGHVEIALPAEIDVGCSSWWILGDGEGNLMRNGWTRYRADDVFKTGIIRCVESFHSEGWLSQANHVFNRLQITSNLENYVRIEHIDFRITLGNARGDPPPGYLFLCPIEDFRTGPTSFRWPNRPAYWSLNPEGIEALSTEEAERLGFPSFQLTTEVGGGSWNAGVYEGLRKFHQAKGFDPDGQDVALHLGYPLYELSWDVDPPFAYVDGFNEAEETSEEEVDTDDECADAQSSLHESGYDEESDVEEGVDQDSICIEPQGVNGRWIHQHESRGNLKSQTANDHPVNSSHRRGFATQSGRGGRLGQHRY